MRESHFIQALRASLSGLAAAWRSEQSFRQEIWLLAASLPASAMLTADNFRRAELIGCLLAVLAVELLNTSVEKLSDRMIPYTDPAIKIVKDLGSAAVLCALCLAGLIWIAAALERFG